MPRDPFVVHNCSKDALHLAGVTSGSRVLDVAAGPGTFALLAARAGAQVVAIDFSAEMIGRLRGRAAGEGLTNVTAAVMDGQALDLPDDSFDVGVSMFGLMFFPERAKGFSELRRVLRNGGRAAVGVWTAPERYWANVILAPAIKQALPDQPPSPPAPWEKLRDASNLASEMLEAGFREVQVHTREYELEFSSRHDVWEALENVPNVVGMAERLGPAKWGHVREVSASNLAREFGDSHVRLMADAHIAIGVK